MPLKTILHIIDTTGPGGAETVFIDLLTQLPTAKFRAVVVIRGKGWVYEELCRRGVEPILLDAKGSFNWRFLLGLRKIIKRERVDLIQSHLLGSNVYASIAGLITNTPVVATFHGAVDIGENERLKGLKFGAINLGARKIIAVSDSLCQNVIARTPLSSKKLMVIYNGIATAEFQIAPTNRLRQQFGWSKDDIIVGSLGNIRPAKGYEVLLQAAVLLKQKTSFFRFVIAGQGSGSLYKSLLKLRHNLDLNEHVQFLGFNDEPAEFLANLDIFLLSSLTEGFSISTLQAMASQLPVVVTKSGGPEEIVTHAENGWLVEAGDAGAIATALNELGQNSDLCVKLSKNACDHARTSFDIEAMIGAYGDVYTNLMRS
ncbi:Glycosyltransferase [hydrothermal vent metagenome]|uniref:Glycosyltransferase n=1 Tax=hydrothermal vent metagenome TaxID=652676 RepID=A0A3B0Y878_9ZZZZ